MPFDPRLEPQRVLLVGMMGSGKTTVGRALAARTGWPFLDNDDLLERRTGRTARELRAAGLEALRAGERLALSEGLAARPPVIVGIAAGVVLYAGDRSALAAGGTVVWLRAAPETLARRLLAAPEGDGGSHRPWLDGGPEATLAWLRAEHERRESLYASLDAIAVAVETRDGADRPPAELAAAVAAAVTTTVAARAQHPG